MMLRLVLSGLALVFAALPLHAAALKESDLAAVGVGLKAQCANDKNPTELPGMTAADNAQFCSCYSNLAVTKLRAANFENQAASTAADKKLVASMMLGASAECGRVPLTRLLLKDYLPSCLVHAPTLKVLKGAPPATVEAACRCAIGKLANTQSMLEMAKHPKAVLVAAVTSCAAK